MTNRSNDDDEVLFSDIVKAITEYKGRRRPVLPPEFPENEVVAGPYPLKANLLSAGFVPAFPNLDAIVVSNNGERKLARGGYIRLPAGNYKLYYVDRHEQNRILPDIKATTSDGAEVAITCSITFTVNDSLAVQNVRNPLDALFKACEAVLRQVVRTHKHDEVINERADNTGQMETDARGLEMISNDQISAAVQHQVAMSEACRAFTLHNITILNRQGHQRLLDIREEEIVQLRAGRKEIKHIEQKTQMVKGQRLLTVQQGSVSARQATNEVNRRKIMYEAEELVVRLEWMRKQPDYQNQRVIKTLDVRIEALKALMQAQAMPGSSRSEDELRLLVERIVTEIPHLANEALPGAPPAPEGLSDGGDDDDDFIELLIPKKKR